MKWQQKWIILIHQPTALISLCSLHCSDENCLHLNSEVWEILLILLYNGVAFSIFNTLFPTKILIEKILIVEWKGEEFDSISFPLVPTFSIQTSKFHITVNSTNPNTKISLMKNEVFRNHVSWIQCFSAKPNR